MESGTKNKAKRAASAVKKGATSAAKKTGQFVSKNPKTAMYIGLGVIGVAIIYTLVKKTTGTVDKLFNGDPNIDDNVTIVLGDLKIDTKKLSIDNAKAKIFAQQLLDAMNVKEPLWGTDEKTIEAVFKKITSEDFKIIFWEFGKKDYNGYNSPPKGWFSNIDSYEPRNLIYWLQHELDPVADATVYKLVKSKIEGAGFVFA